jgi:hypothetical protein
MEFYFPDLKFVKDLSSYAIFDFQNFKNVCRELVDIVVYIHTTNGSTVGWYINYKKKPMIQLGENHNTAFSLHLV